MDVGYTPLLSFVGTLLALGVTKTFERVLTRRQDASDLTRDVLVDFASTLTSVERTLAVLAREPAVSRREDLPSISSAFSRRPPTISLERMLGVFHDERLHRSLMLFFDRQALFAESSDERRAAFYWLIDRPETPAEDLAAQERLGVIRHSRAQMTQHCLDMLRHGYEVVEHLFDRAERAFAPMRSDFAETRAFLKSKYGLDSETLRLRRAYYSAERLGGDEVQAAPFDPSLDYGLTSWDGPLANEVAARGGCLQLRLESPSQDCRLLLSFSPEMEVALPRNARVVRAHVYLRGPGADGVHHAVELEQLGVTRLPVVGRVRLEGRSHARLGDVLRERGQ